jgi:pimeloyl-ACP methyl ester carboxylesterase
VIESYKQPLLIEIDGVFRQISRAVTTPANPDATVILIHDIEGNGADFSPVASRLARQGFCVVAPDLPGRGDSAWLSSEAYGLQSYVKVIAAVAKEIPEGPLYLFGERWGALIALATENVLARPLAGLVLWNLPRRWALQADTSAQAWHSLAGTAYSDIDALAGQATSRFGLQPQAGLHGIDFLMNRVRPCAEGLMLALDPTVVSAAGARDGPGYDAKVALNVVKTRVWLLATLQDLGKWQELASPRETVLPLPQPMDYGWYCPARLLALCGVFALAKGDFLG